MAMFLLVNQRIYPQMSMALGLVFMLVAVFYLYGNDSIAYYNWPLAKAEVHESVGRHLTVSYTDDSGYEHMVDASYMTRDYRSYNPPKEGETITIRYNPSSPEDVVISFGAAGRILVVGGLGFLFLYGLAHFFAGIRYYF